MDFIVCFADALLSGTVWDGDSGRDEVANLLFFMHEWFISSGDLAQIFISLYPCAFEM